MGRIRKSHVAKCHASVARRFWSHIGHVPILETIAYRSYDTVVPFSIISAYNCNLFVSEARNK
jgi:hypothetical protein